MSTSVEDYLLWHWFGNVSLHFSSLMLRLFFKTLPFNSSILVKTGKVLPHCQNIPLLFSVCECQIIIQETKACKVKRGLPPGSFAINI